VAQEHIGVLREDHKYGGLFELRSTGGLFRAKCGEAGDELEVWVDDKPVWPSDDYIKQQEEEEEQVPPVVEQDVDVLTRGDGGPSAHSVVSSWEAQLQALDWGSVPGLLNLLPPMPASHEAHSPINENVMKAFQLTRLADVRCVLVAKYPYTDPALATGLALSPGVPKHQFHTGVLFKALADPRLNFASRSPRAADLTTWATRAGVLLLNASLQDATKEAERAWKPFLSKAIDAVCHKATREGLPVGFIFLGAEAKKLKGAVHGASQECVIECAYPAMQHTKPFVDNPPFLQVDAALERHGAARIPWEVLLD